MDLSYPPPARFRDALDMAHELAAAELATDDFGPGDYLPGLRALLQSMDYDPHFSATGRCAAWGQVIGVLKARGTAIAAMKARPGFDHVPILAPVVITGIPRTGTTALHRLMAVDPRFQGLQSWLADAPMPRPPIDQWEDYPQFRQCVAQLAARYHFAPGKRAAHNVAAAEVHECCMILRHAFVSNLWNCGWSAPTYDAWWQCQSEAPAYHYYHRCLQLIGAHQPDTRWLLKNPGHIAHLDLLLATFPDARIIQTHRDPARAVPSLVSLLMQSHSVMEDGRADQRGAIMLAREVAKWADATRKAAAVRAAHPGQVLDIVHNEFHAAPMQVLDRIYAFIGWPIDDELRAAFARRIKEKPELAHGAHHYTITDYGMSEDDARAPFGDYIEQYDLIEHRDPAGSSGKTSL